MTVSEAIEKIQKRINDNYDSGYPDEVIINYINDSIKYLANALITRNDPLLVKMIDIYSGQVNPVPKNFVRFAGGLPVKRIGNEFILLSGDFVHAKYFYIPDEVANLDDVLPFENNDTYNAIIINLASIYALNQHEFNVERDTVLRQELEQIVTQALGAVE